MQPGSMASALTLMALALAVASSANCCNVTECEHETVGLRRVLNCSSRGFRCFPPSIPNVDVVDLSDNQITELQFDESYYLIRELYLNNNDIQGLLSKKQFYRLRALEVLSVDNNYLFNARRLGLFSLSELYLNRNNLVGLPELNQIEVLSANYNSLAGELFLQGTIGVGSG